MKVSMIGPVPVHWGGGFGWRGGGIASHVQGILPRLLDYQVEVHFFADNSHASKSTSFPDFDKHIQFIPAIRSPFRLILNGFVENLGLARQMLQMAELRATIPGQFMRFWGQAINYNQFLKKSNSHLLHVHQPYNRQFLCQAVVGINIPVVVTAHSVNILLEPHPDWAEQIIFANYQNADWFIAVSNFVKRKIIEFGANPDIVTVINNGVNSDKFNPGIKRKVRDKLHLPQERFLFLYSGNLIKRKGVDVLIKAFSKARENQPNIYLVIIGDGFQRQELKQLAEDCGVQDNILFGGYKPFDEMPLWYQASDVFVMPSWAEGLSMSILEAMASGCPVITTRPQSGKHDAVEQDQTGLLTNYGNVEQLARAMSALTASPDLVSRLSDEARFVAVNKFDWASIAQKTADVYRHVLKTKRS